MDVPFQCPFCEHANQQGANYCSNCGQRLQLKVCPECGVVNDQMADRCYQCGTLFAATSDANAPQAACERLREILRGDANSFDLGGDSPASENGRQAGAEPSAATQTAARNTGAQHSDSEPAIARERFSSERMFRFPDGDDNGLSQDFNLLRPTKVPLAPDVDAESAPAQRQLQPVHALQTTDTTHRPPLLAPGTSSRVRSMLSGTRAKWVGATVAISIAVLAYSIYRVAATEPPGAIRGQSVPPVQTSADVAPGRLPIRNVDGIGADSRATATGGNPNAAAVKALGITVPVATGNDVVTPPGSAGAPALDSSNQAQSRARDQAASPVELPSAPLARVQSSAKDSATRSPNAPAAASPITCTEGVVALGLCTRADEENK